MTLSNYVLFDQVGAYGLITLNRPNAYNANNTDMILSITEKLIEWRDNNAIKAVIIDSAFEKAFCSGGDVKAVCLDTIAYQNGDSEGMEGAEFFYAEYRLNYLIKSYPKPYIALVNGVCMGGGVGISLYGSHRIVSETLKCAMPETSIGHIPDVGCSVALHKAPLLSGLYIGLTGYQMDYLDALYIGYGTNFVLQDDFDNLKDVLTNGLNIDEAIHKYEQFDKTKPNLKKEEKNIYHYFSESTLIKTLSKLEKDEASSEFAHKNLMHLRRNSPMSLALFWEQFKRGKNISLKDALVMEYRLSQFCCYGHDFMEGIRARLIDKDNKPDWLPKTIEDVDMQIVNGAFDTIPKKGDLTFIE